MSIADATERTEALDVQRSFCVTAPAGSGKTELLIQRFLALLGRVQRPEQVLAITFTRKAAAEMRERVLQALQSALARQPCAGAHEEVTRRLAEAALARSAAEEWHLTRDISRLNIRTIDGFCSGLTRQMPILSRFGGQAQTVDDAAELYQEAVAELFAMLGSEQPVVPDLEALLLHFDNNWERLRQLLVTMLGKRDQWHEYMGTHHSPEESEQALLHSVTAVVGETLADIQPLLDEWQDELLDLLCYSLANLGKPQPDDFPVASTEQAEYWRQLRAMLLTQDGKWRKSVTVRDGFPAGKGEATERKDHLKDLIGRLSGVKGLREALQTIAWLPDMSGNASSWQMVLHLSHVLPTLSACLLLVFQRRGLVDHSQVALSALDALGEDDTPTELALRLDYAIEHILVDEFQDTAINQYLLVERLTRGWGQHNGINPQAPRTIFIVGDGMQSIYGFRDANVGLFLKAQREGFNGVLPQPLALRCNFRSDAGVVDWVNTTFRRAFPAEDNIRRGRVSFTDAVAVRPTGPAAAVSLHAFHGDHAKEQEAALLVEEVRAGLADDSVESIAILGRSRSQLAPVLAQLQAAGIPYAAQEMDRLAGSPAIVDLVSLCRALAHPGDRVAWFALLRAPWCGLTLADLRVLSRAGEGGRYQSVAVLLSQGPGLEGLSVDGRERVAHLAACLQWAESKRDRLALRVWLEQVWLRLGGPATLHDPAQLEDAELLFELLQQAEQEGVGLDVSWLENRLERLYASGKDAAARLQVMTLHKAKGLEFDWVLIPALASATRGDSRDLLLWDEYISPGGERGFLLAADDHNDDKAATLYNFLKRLRRDKTRLETTRLLYVGATRAVRRLVMSACLKTTEEESDGSWPPVYRDPGEGSLLASIWPSFREQLTAHAPLETVQQEAPLKAPRLWRLRALPEPRPEEQEQPAEGPNIPERRLNWVDREVGTAIHLALEELSALMPLPNTLPPALATRCQQALRQAGLAGDLLDTAWERVAAAVQKTLDDTAGGRWILSAKHPQAHSELALTRQVEGKVMDIVVDRTFVDADSGLRWIVDYKSSQPVAGESLQAFAAREAETYREQLRGYRDALRQQGPEPLRCALYFTGLAHLHHLPELDLPGG